LNGYSSKWIAQVIRQKIYSCHSTHSRSFVIKLSGSGREIIILEDKVAQYKVVITDFGEPDYTLESEVIAASGLDIELVRLNARTPEELIPAVVDADALIVQWVKITRQVIEQLNHCKVISRYGIGVDMVDLAAATERGIPVCNVPDYCIEEVSTHTMAFVLALNRHLLAQHIHIRSGKWGGAPGGAPSRLSGQVMGVVGLGRIGREVARKARGLGLRVLGHDPYLKPETVTALGIEPVSLEDLLRASDYVSLHCPLTAETRHLIGPAQLALMKPSAYLVNMARGPIVDQGALYQALASGAIKGAALDVLEQEPPAPDEPLLKLDNVIFTPHAASWTLEAVVQLRRETTQNVVTVLEGKLPRSIVNWNELEKKYPR
jgi:D-3-phosphoglycerate dehydrogenase